jgi:hypothetical protein
MEHAVAEEGVEGVHRSQRVPRLAADPNRRHVEHVLRDYVEHHNTERRHRALGHIPSDPRARPWRRLAMRSSVVAGSAGSSTSAAERPDDRGRD